MTESALKGFRFFFFFFVVCMVLLSIYIVHGLSVISSNHGNSKNVIESNITVQDWIKEDKAYCFDDVMYIIKNTCDAGNKNSNKYDYTIKIKGIKSKVYDSIAIKSNEPYVNIEPKLLMYMKQECDYVITQVPYDHEKIGYLTGYYIIQPLNYKDK